MVGDTNGQWSPSTQALENWDLATHLIDTPNNNDRPNPEGGNGTRRIPMRRTYPERMSAADRAWREKIIQPQELCASLALSAAMLVAAYVAS
jgi:hypothetical protein